MNGKVGWAVLAVLVLSLAVVPQGVTKPHPVFDPKTMFPCDYPLPLAVEQLPVKKPHFWISITFDTATLTVVPKIYPPYTNENPLKWMKQNWKKYNVHAHEALQWLEDHKLGRAVRKEWNIKIDWWMDEYWPRGAKGPEATFHPAKRPANPRAKPKSPRPNPQAKPRPQANPQTRATRPPSARGARGTQRVRGAPGARRSQPNPRSRRSQPQPKAQRPSRRSR